jgi:hypothetical protein
MLFSSSIQENNTMSRLAIGALLLSLALPVAVSAQDISGTWDVTVTSPQGPLTIEAIVVQKGEAVTGTVVSPLGKADFTGTLVDGTLAVAYSLKVQDQALDIKMKGKVEPDSMAGTIDLGGLGEVPWTAKRKPAAAAAADAAQSAAPSVPGSLTDTTGNWTIALRLPQGELPLSAALKQEGEKVTGTITSPLGEIPVTGTFVGSALKLEFTVQAPNGPLPVTMNGELSADGLAGKAGLGGLGEADWTGRRKP